MFNQAPRPPRPNYSELGEKFKKNVKRILIVSSVVIVVLILLFGSIFTLNSGEEAVILRFGSYVETITTPGLQFKIPLVDKKHIVNVEGIQRLEFGYASDTESTNFVQVESLMLTKEENLVNADWVVQYRVDNSYDFLFNVEDPIGTLKIISQSTYRRVVASHPLDDILTNQKEAMQFEILQDLQKVCDKYKLGITISAVQLQDAAPPDSVKAAFLDVTNAIEDKNAKIHEASKYANEQLPQARGQAEAQINNAEAYKAKRINEAVGSVARYQSIEKEFTNNTSVMRTRLYLEMIKEVMPKLDKIYFVESDGQMLEFLPLGGSKIEE